MSTSLTSKAETAVEPVARGLVPEWGPLGLLAIAICYASSSVFFKTATTSQAGLISSAFQPFVLFAIGLAPMFGAALVVWTSRNCLSLQERRSQLVGAAMSAVLFFPALLLVRFFA
jgi:hypothetical protein